MSMERAEELIEAIHSESDDRETLFNKAMMRYAAGELECTRSRIGRDMFGEAYDQVININNTPDE